jgi:hypothetical protein
LFEPAFIGLIPERRTGFSEIDIDLQIFLDDEEWAKAARWNFAQVFEKADIPVWTTVRATFSPECL